EHVKQTAVYFYLELTEKEDEVFKTMRCCSIFVSTNYFQVLFVPRSTRPASQFNPEKALFGDVPSGYIDTNNNENRLYLFDLLHRCVYSMDLKEIGDMTQKYTVKKPFRVNRTNYQMEHFLRCHGEK